MYVLEDFLGSGIEIDIYDVEVEGTGECECILETVWGLSDRLGEMECDLWGEGEGVPETGWECDVQGGVEWGEEARGSGESKCGVEMTECHWSW